MWHGMKFCEMRLFWVWNLIFNSLPIIAFTLPNAPHCGINKDHRPQAVDFADNSTYQSVPQFTEIFNRKNFNAFVFNTNYISSFLMWDFSYISMWYSFSKYQNFSNNEYSLYYIYVYIIYISLYYNMNFISYGTDQEEIVRARERAVWPGEKFNFEPETRAENPARKNSKIKIFQIILNIELKDIWYIW